MKPTHFKKIDLKAACANCAYRHWIQDQNRNICCKHDFTLPDTGARYECADFKNKESLLRAPLIDVLRESPYCRIGDEPITLILKHVLVNSSFLGGFFNKDGGSVVSGKIEAYDKGFNCRIGFQAAKAFVEED